MQMVTHTCISLRSLSLVLRASEPLGNRAARMLSMLLLVRLNFLQCIPAGGFFWQLACRLNGPRGQRKTESFPRWRIGMENRLRIGLWYTQALAVNTGKGSQGHGCRQVGCCLLMISVAKVSFKSNCEKLSSAPCFLLDQTKG